MRKMNFKTCLLYSSPSLSMFISAASTVLIITLPALIATVRRLAMTGRRVTDIASLRTVAISAGSVIISAVLAALMNMDKEGR